MTKKWGVLVRDSKGLGIVETIIAVSILAGVALVAFSYLADTRIVDSRLTTVSQAQDFGANILRDISQRSAGGRPINNARACMIGGAVVPSVDYDVPAGAPIEIAAASLDPFCCTGAYPQCDATRRNLLCGSFDATSQYETQAMRTSATWARNLYESCMAGTCGIASGGTNICTGDGLVFNTPATIANFYRILPEPITMVGETPREIRLKIQPATVQDFTTPAAACGNVPAGGWTIDHMMQVTIIVLVDYDKGDSTSTSQFKYTMQLFWPRDAALNAITFNPSAPTHLMPNTTLIQTAGIDTLVATPYANGGNLDNKTYTNTVPSPNQARFQDGTVRGPANTYCSGNKFGPDLWQQSGYTYAGWDKLFFQATSVYPGVVPYCVAGGGTSGASLNVCCESINNGVVADESVAGAGTTYSIAWNTAAAEGTVIGIGQMDSMGNKALSYNVMFTPGYCPPTTTYCADGSRTGAEMSGSADAAYVNKIAGTGAGVPPRCPATSTFPLGAAYTPTIGGATDIYCHPHDGCWSNCPMGTRSAAGVAGANLCPPTTVSYCSIDRDGVGADLGNYDPAANRGCTGKDCTMDLRADPTVGGGYPATTTCGQTVCDDCGHDTCPDSTIAVTAVNRALAVTAPFPVTGGPWGNYTPYADTASFPSVYLGFPLNVDGGCPDTNSYCPVGARAPATLVGAGIYFLPKDNCGNSCPDGTRIYQGCPADRTTYCSLAPVMAAGTENQDRIRTGPFAGARSPRCSMGGGSGCSAAAPNNGPVDDCQQYCLPSTFVPQTACPATNTYCPTSGVPTPAIPVPLIGGAGPNWLPADACGNDCPDGTLPAPDGTAMNGCAAQNTICYNNNPGVVKCAPPAVDVKPTDVCGRDCLVTNCSCPDPAVICNGRSYNDPGGAPCGGLACNVTGSMPWPGSQSAANWCPNFADNTGVNDDAGHPFATAWCTDPNSGHVDNAPVVGTKPEDCAARVGHWCIGDAMGNNCGVACAGGAKPFSGCLNASYCQGIAVPDQTCTDDVGWWGDAAAVQYATHAQHNLPCGTGSIAWSGCAAPASAPCGQAINDTCSDPAGLHSNACAPGSGYNAAQCTANKPGTACNVQTVDNCGNTGCGLGSACGT
jgi:hypothetical protein